MTELSSIEHRLPATPFNEGIFHQVSEWPKAMQETTCQKICRIVYNILSVIIFPIGLLRLTGWVISVLIEPMILPSAYRPERAAEVLQIFGQETWGDLASQLSPRGYIHESTPSEERFLDILASQGEEGVLLREFLQSMQTSIEALSQDLDQSDFRALIGQEEMGPLVDNLIVSLNRLPDALLSKFLLSQLSFGEPSDIGSNLCASRPLPPK